MRLSPSDKLGPYEILGDIGAGGMGEVYRARDTRLDRIVALKILPPGVGDPDLTRRFEREARAVAVLNHPNICVVHDVGHDSGVSYFVMEYLEGETLAARLSRGALPIRQALQYAVAIADALDKAHRTGVVHRDVKPSNIVLTAGGPKLLDFGLAKLMPVSPGRGAVETMTAGTDLTVRGTILGTLQYMAPEQIEGLEADTRTDIFAFGAILYEMVTGAKAFTGNSQASLMAAVLEHDPIPMAASQRVTPALERLVAICLAKAPDDRWQSARDLKLQLEGIAASFLDQGQAPARNRREWIAWSAAAITTLALLVGGVFYSRTPQSESPVIEFTVPTPENSFPRMPLDPFTTVSPDGRHIAFTVRTQGDAGQLWVRSLDSVEDLRALPGTEDAFTPFWSHDSEQIGFFTTNGLLKAVPREGGPVRVLCPVASPLGGTWNRDGVILFSTAATSEYTNQKIQTIQATGLYRIAGAGGAPTRLDIASPSPGESRVPRYGAREGWPHFLPDGRHFLFLERDSMTVHVGSLESSTSTALLPADSQATYAAPGYLLFVRQGMLMAQEFDARRLELGGEPFRVAENVRFSATLGGAVFSASQSGLLAYSLGLAFGPTTRTWFDRTGPTSVPLDLTPGIAHARLSPDGSRIAQLRRSPGYLADIWTVDLNRGNSGRVTSGEEDEERPVWSPDGAQIVYAANPEGVFDLYRIAASGSGSETLVYKSRRDKRPSDWSSDGGFLVFEEYDPVTRTDILALNLTDGGEPQPIVRTPAADDQPRLAPGGDWIAYRSNRNGRFEVFVQRFPSGDPHVVSVNGGAEPFWRDDGRELFFTSPDNWLMTVSFDPTAGSPAGVPTRLFELPARSCATCISAAITREGRFLIITSDYAPEPPIRVFANWPGAVKHSGRSLP
jgi:serine/threonine protein kinase